MKHRILFIFITQFLSSYNENSVFAGTVVYDRLGDSKLAIYLPDGYEQSNKNYPVFYMLDGQTLFGKNSRSWKFEKKLDEWIKNGKISPILLVGIFSTNSRASELVPYDDPYITENWGDYQPQAGKTAKFIVEKLIPYIETNYKAYKSKDKRAIAGVSFGGLLAIWMTKKYSDQFNLFAGLSPSFWVADFKIFRDLKRTEPEADIWFDIGTEEWNYYIPAINILEKQGFIYGENLFYLEVKDGTHSPESWIDRVIYPLILFNGNKNPDIVSMEVKIEIIPSFNSNRIYKRINPVVELKNGLKYSLVSKANYEVLNKDAGKVQPDGSFEINRDKELIVKISYHNFTDTIYIPSRSIPGLDDK